MAPLAVAAALRLGLMFAAFVRTGTGVITQGDTSSYLEPGKSLILHGVFATLGMPETDRTPGYPIFAGLTGAIFGNLLLTVVAQILLSLVSLLLVRKIAVRIFSSRDAGTVAAWLYAIEPLSIVSAVRLMPETLFVLLLLLVIERLLTFQKSGRLPALAAAGFLLAAATYVRPVSYYLGPALAVGLAATSQKRRGLCWKAPAVLLISLVPWLAGWQARNYLEAGYSGFSSIVEQNLYFYQSAEITAELEHISLGAEQEKLGYSGESAYLMVHPEQRQWSQSQRLRFMRVEALKILAAHPGMYLKTHLVGVGVVALTPGAAELLQLLDAYPAPDSMPHRILNEGVARSALRVFLAHPIVTVVMALLEAFLLLLYSLAIRGCGNAYRADPAILTVIGIAMYFLLIAGGAQAIGRYRAPVMPVLCILAAGGVVALRRKKLRGDRRPAVKVHSMS